MIISGLGSQEHMTASAYMSLEISYLLLSVIQDANRYRWHIQLRISQEDAFLEFNFEDMSRVLT